MDLAFLKNKDDIQPATIFPDAPENSNGGRGTSKTNINDRSKTLRQEHRASPDRKQQ